VAILSERMPISPSISRLTVKDNHSRRGLLKTCVPASPAPRYLKRTEEAALYTLIEKLGIRR